MKNTILKSSVLALLLFAVFFYGAYSATQENVLYRGLKYLYGLKSNLLSDDEKQAGMWNVARDTKNKKLSDEQQRAVSQLSSLPYFSGTNSAPDVTNITIYKEDKVSRGVNLMVSGHAPEAVLTDMQGRLLHKWSYRFADVWPGPLEFDEWDVHQTFWRRAHLFENGDLLAIFEGIGMIKLDRDSNLVWQNKCRAHHDLHVTDTGEIYTLGRYRVEEHERLELDGPILEDFVVILNSQGEVTKKVSLLDAFLDSDYASLLVNMKRKGDVFHTNAVEVLSGRFTDMHPMFEAGDVLISVPTLHAIAVVDLELERVTWAQTGMWLLQHEPTALQNGNLLLFDNMGHDLRSKVIEFNPLTKEVVWAYRGSETEPFFSKTLGSCQRLPNGNTLITESNNGRAFEVTPQNEIVWEFFNPHRAGEKDELIATLFEVVRFEEGYLADSAMANFEPNAD